MSVGKWTSVYTTKESQRAFSASCGRFLRLMARTNHFLIDSVQMLRAGSLSTVLVGKTSSSMAKTRSPIAGVV